jgi:hypothetical protein
MASPPSPWSAQVVCQFGYSTLPMNKLAGIGPRSDVERYPE